MAEKLQLQVSQPNLDALLAGKTTIADFLNELFKDTAKHNLMCNSLKEYHRNDGGSPEVHAFDVVNTSFNTEAMTGHFRCTFRVAYHYTCSDIKNTAADTIDWDFKLDHTNATMHLTGEEPWVREGDEY